jgi:hypothetical protein
MKRDVAEELLTLRRLHEQRALETLTKCEANLKTAKRAASDAQDETRHYEAAARVQEVELIAQLTGKAAASEEISRLHSVREHMSFAVGQLRAVETRAASNTQRAQEDVADAQEAARLRQKAVLKLETFVKKHRRRIERRRTELAEEEQTTQGRGRQAPRTSR